VRIERFHAPLAYAEAFTSLVAFYASGSGSESEPARTDPADPAVAALAALPHLAVLALAHAAAHLARFGLADALRHARFFAPFAARTHMLLHGNTLANLCARPARVGGHGKLSGTARYIGTRTTAACVARCSGSWTSEDSVRTTSGGH
jgi:hypothetical protein